MPTPITITAGDLNLAAELNDSPTAQQIAAALPLDGRASRWGDEYYFSIPVDVAAEPDARAEFDVGELGFWPPGSAFCIFFGPTPASTGERPVMANPGNPVGRLLDDPAPLKSLPGSLTVHVERANG